MGDRLAQDHRAVAVERSRMRGWNVVAPDSGWLISAHNSESAAVAAARKAVAASGGGVVIHGFGATAAVLEEAIEA